MVNVKKRYDLRELFGECKYSFPIALLKIASSIVQKFYLLPIISNQRSLNALCNPKLS